MKKKLPLARPFRISSRWPPTTERRIISFINKLPLPWTLGMIKAWFGEYIGTQVGQTAYAYRIWRIERGIYWKRPDRNFWWRNKPLKKILSRLHSMPRGPTQRFPGVDIDAIHYKRGAVKKKK